MLNETIKYLDRSVWSVLLKRPSVDLTLLESSVRTILEDIAQHGDEALIKYTKRFDKAEISDFLVEEKEFEEAEKNIADELKQAIGVAKRNIEKFHISQKEEALVIETMPGVKCWRKAIGIGKVGLYIPGGTAPLFSTVLMLGIPAKLAGCAEIILCSPPGEDGKINEVILYAAKLCGITKVFRVGGAQAIAALAYGTETIPKADKIFGPGNQYVTCAKQLVNAKGVAIDMPAGPSELAILADRNCVPAYVAADLLSQAEHGPDSQVILVSNDEKVLEYVKTEIKKQLTVLPRTEIAKAALKNSRFILVKDVNEGIDLLNEYAPEHLIIACENNEELAARVISSGSVFLGNYSCESAGDYASGTNHTLPTNGYAKAYSGVSLDSFQKKITFQKIDQEGIKNIGRTIELMAEAEGLQAHKNAVSIRLKNENNV